MIENIPAKTLLCKLKNDNNKWFGTDYTVNLYKGCCHGCIYCDSRSECYHIEDFGKVRVKQNISEILEKELRSKYKRGENGVIGIGAMSDTYNPFEKELCVTRCALELIYKYGFGISIDTKSSLIVRDTDIIKSIADRNAAIVKMTVTASDDSLSSIIEPNVCVSSERFSAIYKLSSAGVFCGILLMPVLPFITDSESNIRNIVRLSEESGARFIYPMFGVTLRQNQRQYFYQRVEEIFPNKNMMKQYIEIYGNNYVCTSKNAERLWKTFEEECKKRGILYRMKDIISAYKKPQIFEQISLFD